MKTPFGNFNVPGKMDFVKGDEGIWSFTSDSIASDIYTYNLIIDGVRTTDPNNVYMVRDVASVFSVFLVEGGKAICIRLMRFLMVLLSVVGTIRQDLGKPGE